MKFDPPLRSRYRHSVSDRETPTGGNLVEILRPEIEETIERLRGAIFKPDPIVDDRHMKAVNVVSSAFKRHGYILEQAILKRIQRCRDFVVWSDAEFQVCPNAEDAAARRKAELKYGQRGRPLQIDAFVYNKSSPKLGAYEAKNGNAYFDAGKRRSMQHDDDCVRLLLKSYGETRNIKASHVSSHIIFYYER